ncbi:MAG: tRNA (guanosine(46)-N7)-methyltransferase TrmB [Gammaproteobacteria bacterium]|nr:tRNA (guanosine(46)-N7)-methyltransferase TrmB [Gammaproteobacteria bacterium]
MNEKSRRKIRSFVRREGRMTPRQKMGLEKHWAEFSLGLAGQPYNLNEVFAKVAPVFLEIGFGMGQSLCQMARENPDINFIGVEVHRPGVGSLLSDIADAGLQNIKVFCEDVNLVLKQCTPNNSLDRINVYFPDPWPKKRHHKRRLIQADFIALLAHKLKQGGLLHLATDWSDYTDWMLDVMSKNDHFTRIPEDVSEYKCEVGLRPETKFERRGLKLGHRVDDILYKLTDFEL